MCRQSEFRAVLVEPLITSLGLRDDFNAPCVGVPGSSKLEVLFTDRPEAIPLYQSIVESVGVTHLEAVNELVADVVGSWNEAEFNISLDPIIDLSTSIADAARCNYGPPNFIFF